jgi:ribosome biogenesis GTPase A
LFSHPARNARCATNLLQIGNNYSKPIVLKSDVNNNSILTAILSYLVVIVQDIYELFSKELDTTLKGFAIEHKLTGDVFSENPISNELLFVDREKQAPELARALAKLLNGTTKKVIITGERGVGKSSLVNYLIKKREEDEKDLCVLRIPKYEYSNPNFKQDFLVQFIMEVLLTQTFQTRDEGYGEKLNKLAELLRNNQSLDEVIKKAKELGFCTKDKNDEEALYTLIETLANMSEKKVIIQ